MPAVSFSPQIGHITHTGYLKAVVMTIDGFIRPKLEQTHNFSLASGPQTAHFDGLLFSILLIS